MTVCIYIISGAGLTFCVIWLIKLRIEPAERDDCTLRGYDISERRKWRFPRYRKRPNPKQ